MHDSYGEEEFVRRSGRLKPALVAVVCDCPVLGCALSCADSRRVCRGEAFSGGVRVFRNGQDVPNALLDNGLVSLAFDLDGWLISLQQGGLEFSAWRLLGPVGLVLGRF
jgi:hypothetical protein